MIHGGPPSTHLSYPEIELQRYIGMRRLKVTAALLNVVFLQAISVNAYARQSTKALAVLVNVITSCQLWVADQISKDSVERLTETTVGMSAIIRGRCTNQTPFRVDIDAGVGKGITDGNRDDIVGGNTRSNLHTISAGKITRENIRDDTWLKGTDNGLNQKVDLNGHSPSPRPSLASEGPGNTIRITINF